MFLIHAQKDNVTKISIIGGIGKSLKGKGVTLQEIQSQISAVTGDIEVEIRSLGGSGYEGILIHEALKNHTGKVSTKITGYTASAGTYPFLSGSKRQIAANAKFLIHDSHVKEISGNAKRLKLVVDELEEFDEIQAELYLPYCSPMGKTLEDIKSLMAEERYITAEEAIEWGFATEIIEEYAIAAEYTHEIVEAAGLPKLPDKYYIQMENKSSVDKFLASIGLQTIKAEVTTESLQEENDTLKAENEALKAKLSETETSATAEKETIIEASKTSLSEIEAKYTEVQAELETTKADLAKALAGTVEIVAGVDPNPTGEPTPISASNPFPLSERAKAMVQQAKAYTELKN